MLYFSLLATLGGKKEFHIGVPFGYEREHQQ
jgi:hypothetical protein